MSSKRKSHPMKILSDAQLQKVVVRWPAVLGLSFEANVVPSLAALQSRLQLSDSQLQKVVFTKSAPTCPKKGSPGHVRSLFKPLTTLQVLSFRN